MLLEHMKELWIKLSDHKELIDQFKNAADDMEYDNVFKEAGCSFTVDQIKKNISTMKNSDKSINSVLDSLSDLDLELVSGGTGAQSNYQPDSQVPDAVMIFLKNITLVRRI